MNANMSVIADDNSIHIEGSFMGDSIERMELICAVADCLGVTSPQEWAELVVHSALRGKKNRGDMERYEMRIPRTEES